MSLPVALLKKRRGRRRVFPQIEGRGRGVPITIEPEDPAEAPASLMVNRYPTGLDDVPTINDNETPLSGIFHNFLALMLEAAMQELGTFETLPVSTTIGQRGLMDFLGLQFAESVSNWRSFSKSFGGNEAGQIYGLIKKQHSLPASSYGGTVNGVATNHQGQHPNGKQPVLFAEVLGFGLTAAEMVAGIGGGIRGEVNGVLSSQFQYVIRGSPATFPTPGAPAGSFTQRVNVLLAFPVEAP